jgi:hypothetical protein
MNRFEQLDSPNHPDYVPRQYGPGDWTIKDFYDLHKDEPGEKSLYSLSADLVTHCAAFFGDHIGPEGCMDHNTVTDMLVEAGVCAQKDTDSESGAFYVYYKTLKDAGAFIKRFNRYLKKRLEDAETKEMHERLVKLREVWEKRIRAAIKDGEGWVPQAKGLNHLEVTLADPNSEYVVLAKRDLDRIQKLAKKHKLTKELVGLEIEIVPFLEAVS